jgi:hypothetical protein
LDREPRISESGYPESQIPSAVAARLVCFYSASGPWAYAATAQAFLDLGYLRLEITSVALKVEQRQLFTVLLVEIVEISD